MATRQQDIKSRQAIILVDFTMSKTSKVSSSSEEEVINKCGSQTSQFNALAAESFSFFEEKLHYILSQDEYKDIIGWMPHGRSFRILDSYVVEGVGPKYFGNFKFNAFEQLPHDSGYKLRLQTEAGARQQHAEGSLPALRAILKLRTLFPCMLFIIVRCSVFRSLFFTDFLIYVVLTTPPDGANAKNTFLSAYLRTRGLPSMLSSNASVAVSLPPSTRNPKSAPEIDPAITLQPFGRTGLLASFFESLTGLIHS